MQDTCFSNWATGALRGLYLTLDQFAILQGVIVWSRAATVSCAAAFIRLLLCAHKYCYLCHMWCVRATLTSIFPVSWWCLVAQHLPEQSTCVGAHRDWKSLYLKYWTCCFIITTSPSLQIYLHVLQSALSVCVSAVLGGCWMFSLHKNLTKTLFRQKSSKDKKCMQRWKCPFSEYPVLYKL